MGRQLLHILTLILLTVVANVTQGAESVGITSAAMVRGGKAYSILTDQLGTPSEAYDSEGNEVWSRVLDMDGNVIEETGDWGMVPFLFQGQYYDPETGLAYNRFRYYDPKTGAYISQDPIGLEGGILNLYGYVADTNLGIDCLGLSELLDLLNEAHSQLDPTAQKFKTTAIRKDTAGNIFISSSDPKVPKVQEEWAKQKGITVIHSRGKDVHAEESLIKANKGIIHIDASRGVCIDCEMLMAKSGVTTDTPKTGKKSKKLKETTSYEK